MELCTDCFMITIINGTHGTVMCLVDVRGGNVDILRFAKVRHDRGSAAKQLRVNEKMTSFL